MFGEVCVDLRIEIVDPESPAKSFDVAVASGEVDPPFSILLWNLIAIRFQCRWVIILWIDRNRKKPDFLAQISTEFSLNPNQVLRHFRSYSVACRIEKLNQNDFVSNEVLIEAMLLTEMINENDVWELI